MKDFKGKLYANKGFDPITIVMEIVSLCFCYYFSLSFFLVLLDVLTGHRQHLG